MKIHRIHPVRRPFARAFTLIELLIVIAIIAVLAALSIGSFSMATKSAARNRTTATLQAITGALERYKADNGDYPAPASSAATHSQKSLDGAEMLYQAITGDGSDKIKLGSGTASFPSSGTVPDANKQYIINGDFIPSENGGTWKSKLNSTMVSSANEFYLMDGFGHPFQYYKAAPAGQSATTVNPTYDLWSYGDIGASDPDDGTLSTKSNATSTVSWIKNW